MIGCPVPLPVVGRAHPIQWAHFYFAEEQDSN